ncbi:MAG: response regulator transcription factor [Oscillospiraceae bacterium]
MSPHSCCGRSTSDIQELLQNYLENEGYQVILASDGEEALCQFADSQADLVLLDLMLPKLDGYQVCKAIRAESDVPVIMLTALDSERHQLRGFDLSIDDYITKPFSMPLLLRKIEAVLRRTTGYHGLRQIVSSNLTLDLDLLQGLRGRPARGANPAGVRGCSKPSSNTRARCSPGRCCSTGSGAMTFTETNAS